MWDLNLEEWHLLVLEEEYRVPMNETKELGYLRKMKKMLVDAKMMRLELIGKRKEQLMLTGVEMGQERNLELNLFLKQKNTIVAKMHIAH